MDGRTAATSHLEPHPWTAPKIGANVGRYMGQSYYPIDEVESADLVKTSVRLPREKHEDIELIAELWNGIDQALGRKRPRKWKAHSVMERLIDVGIDGFWGQVGGRPVTKEDRAKWLQRAISEMKRRGRADKSASE